MWPNPHETEEIVNGKLHFLCSVYNVRTRGYFSISHLLIYIKGMKYTKKTMYEDGVKRWKKFKKKKKKKEKKENVLVTWLSWLESNTTTFNSQTFR